MSVRDAAARDAAILAFSLTALLACQDPRPSPALDVAAVPDRGDAVLQRPLGGIEGGDLQAGEFHEYDLGALAAGAGVHVVLEQRGVDVAAQVVDESDAVVLSVDSPTGDYGYEHVCFVAGRPGSYRLRVGPMSATGAGPYGIRLRERSQPSSGERIRDCEEALRTFAEAEARRSEASAEVAALYQRAIDLWRRSGEPFPLAIALKQAGSYFSRSVDLDTARHYYHEALAVLRGLGDEGDPRQLIGVLNLAGRADELAGEPERARESYEEARAVALKVGYHRGEAAAISNLALWEASGGDLYRAVELHRQALAIWRDLGRRGEEATTLNLLGVALSELGLYEEALDTLHEALEIRRQRPPRGIEGGDQQGDPEPLANSLVAVGWAEHLSGRDEEAIGRFQRAIELYREAGARLAEAGALDRLGSAYRGLGRDDDARHAFETSLGIYRAASHRLYTAHTASNLGCLTGESKLLDEAGDILAAFGDRAALAQVRFCQARGERDAGRLDRALARIEEAVDLVDQIRGFALQHGHPAPILDLWQQYSELHVDILMRLHERDREAGRLDAGREARAFEVSDLARARYLYETLLEARVDVRSGVPEELLEQERSVQRRLNAAELRRQSLLLRVSPLDPPKGTLQNRTEKGVADLEKTVRGLLRELADVQAEIRTASPRFAELRQPSPVRLDEVRELLAPDTLLLSYVLGEERSFLFVVSREGIESHVLPERRTIDELAWRVYEGLRNSRQRRARLQLPALAEKLSDMLLGPVREKLGERRLLVVGDGLLHYVPFAALPLGRSADFVVDHYEVVHLPSVAVMKALRQRAAQRPAPAKELAVVADAVYSTNDDRLPSAMRADPSQDPLLDLPYTAREAASILALVAPEKRLAALGFAARPEFVRGGELSGYRVLHFATHALLHEEHPELSGIALSMFDEEGRPRDGYLRLHEIYALDLPADLVVLSACRTALTREAQGAGLVGLTHGFFYAGASRLLVSVWDVHDEATAELMAAFYRGLLVDGLSPSAALRQAQQWMRRQERWKAAYYWAGFVLEGDWKK